MVQLHIVCKVLALLALLADSNAKASAIASAVVSTVDNTVLTHIGETVTAQKPNADPPQLPQSLYFNLFKDDWRDEQC